MFAAYDVCVRVKKWRRLTFAQENWDQTNTARNPIQYINVQCTETLRKKLKVWGRCVCTVIIKKASLCFYLVEQEICVCVCVLYLFPCNITLHLEQNKESEKNLISQSKQLEKWDESLCEMTHWFTYWNAH